MTVRMMAFAGLSALALTACETVPVDAPLTLSGPAGPSYDVDLAQCQSAARQVGQGHIGKSAAAAAAGGALVGAIESSDDALIGGIAGAAIGAAVADVQVKQAQRDYVVRCMQDRGHPVIG